MQFALLVKSHANARYAQSMLRLATLECECMFFALNANVEIHVETLAGNPFLMLETEGMNEAAWAYLSRHSSISFAALREGEWLRPVALSRGKYLDADLAQVLKYKGKTNPDFTTMMLNCARSASAFALAEEPLTVLDPLCGRGTSLFCALEEGDNAIGIELDEKAVHETDVYFERYLQFHRFKHRREERSVTLPRGGALMERRFTLATTAEDYKRGCTRSLRLFLGDTQRADEIVGAEQCHLIAGDLPYGVQHAPRHGQGIGTLESLLHNALPAFCKALKVGGAVALAFNTYTLPRAVLVEQMTNAGLTPLEEPPFNDFSHWVEQAVNRDMVIAVKRQKTRA